MDKYIEQSRLIPRIWVILASTKHSLQFIILTEINYCAVFIDRKTQLTK